MKNLVPLPYRRVSVQPYTGLMTEPAIRAHLLGRETYRRTDYIVLRNGDATAVVAVTAPDRESLFSPIDSVEVLALPETCVFAEAPETDPANPSALAAKAHELGVGPERTLVVRGKYEHVNFIHHPDPLVVCVVEVAPPDPPKLFGLAQHVLSYADLPPIRLELERIDLNDLAHAAWPRAGRPQAGQPQAGQPQAGRPQAGRPPAGRPQAGRPQAGRPQGVAPTTPGAFLVPCRSGGLDRLSAIAPVHFLDERPERRDWTMIGCERSLQFHRHYYGDEPPRIEMCPRRLAGQRPTPTLLKCCLLEYHIEFDGPTAVVPWGADLKMVEEALRSVVSRQ